MHNKLSCSSCKQTKVRANMANLEPMRQETLQRSILRQVQKIRGIFEMRSNQKLSLRNIVSYDKNAIYIKQQPKVRLTQKRLNNKLQNSPMDYAPYYVLS
jgi:hypothetical protein